MFTPLYGFSFKYFRGVGEQLQRVEELKMVNLFIGSNNSGKSAFLAFVALQLGKFTGRERPQAKTLPYGKHDAHLGKRPEHIEFEVGYPHEALIRAIKDICGKLMTPHAPTDAQLKALCNYYGPTGTVWMTFQGVSHKFIKYSDQPDADPSGHASDGLYALYRVMHPNTTGGSMAQWQKSMNDLLSRDLPKLSDAIFIPAIRQIGPKGHEFVDKSGTGLIDQLAAIQNPGLEQRSAKLKFDAINSFLRVVTDDETATLEIPHDRDAILVHMRDRLLPLSALGTGIHEIVMLAAFCTLADESMVCIEEPEIHLHPSLQRKLMRYLVSRTTNQYFIATHSSVLIDTPGAAVYHVTKNDTQTVIASAASPAQRYEICADLGYRASDIVQANAIIWVEGPSDRIYVRHWIKAVAPELSEGVHYSIMFYGGRLLSHLSAAAEHDADEFIKLRLLNQNVAIVLDSDRRTRSTPINQTKRRVIDELSTGKGVVWLTKGREIENYVSPPLIEAAVRHVHGSKVTAMVATGPYENVLPFRTLGTRGQAQGSIIERVDKVGVAKFISDQPADLSILDLGKQVAKLVEFIQQAND